MFKTRTWVIVLTAAALALSAAAYRTLSAKRETCVVRIVQGSDVLREIDLSRVAEEYSFTVDAPDGGYNVVTVQPGRICVSEADCPDQICVLQGWLSDQTMPIACVPHRFAIVYQDAADADAAVK